MAGPQAGTVREVQEETGVEFGVLCPGRPRVSCHVTKEHDSARVKRHTSTRHATALHAMVWLHISYHARHCGHTSVAGAGRRNAHTELSLSRAGNQWLASSGHPRKYHKANKTITAIQLSDNKIGDGGAIALAASLKATLVTRFRWVRATLSLWPARTPSHRRRSVICVTSVFRCCSVGVARADVCELFFCSVEKPSNISGNGAYGNGEQSLACATRAIDMFFT